MKKLLINVLFFSLLLFLFPYFFTLYFRQENHRIEKYKMNNSILILEEEQQQTLTLDQYICGVLCGDLYSNYHIEMIKAQAVIIRTFVYQTILDKKEELEEGAQIILTTKEIKLPYISLNTYLDWYEEKGAKNNLLKFENAINATKGEIITYKNEIITPFYHYSNSGYTRSSLDAWNVEVPYLIQVESKQDVESEKYIEILNKDANWIINQLKLWNSNIKLDKEKLLEEIQIKERDSIGYVKQVEIGEKNFTGEEIANALNLPSSKFDLQKYENNIQIIIIGSGHGVGFSQFGAQKMALNRKTYREILQHYYPNTMNKIITSGDNMTRGDENEKRKNTNYVES